MKEFLKNSGHMNFMIKEDQAASGSSFFIMQFQKLYVLKTNS